MKKLFKLMLIALALATVGCNYQDVPPTHMGWEFEVGVVSSSKGFIGKALNPGTHSLDYASELYLVQCGESTDRESLQVLTRDGVKAGLDIYVRYAANCNDAQAVEWMLRNVTPNPSLNANKAKSQEGEKDHGEASATANAHTITAYQLFQMYVRAPEREAVRDAGASYDAKEINEERSAIKKLIWKGINDNMDETFGKMGVEGSRPRPVIISEVRLSDIHVPKELTELNKTLASQATEQEIAVKKSKTIEIQIITEGNQKKLAVAKAKTNNAEIEVIAQLVRKNPEYLKWLRVKQAPEMMENMGKGASTLIFGTPPNMNYFMDTGNTTTK